ncbi:MAG: ProQ/FINO family protein [Candidatus Paracaedibacteraceae bacterium]|nr:ProQ/FINO family protein [Candidatus Paracaedibacteraceae bacterium]
MKTPMAKKESTKEKSHTSTHKKEGNDTIRRTSSTNEKRKPKVQLKTGETNVLLSKSERVQSSLEWLHATFPQLFKKQDLLPMKIGTTLDISAWIDVQTSKESIPSKTAIRNAIRIYTSTPEYKKALLENTKRYDLNGIEDGNVEETQKIHIHEKRTTKAPALDAIIAEGAK